MSDEEQDSGAELKFTIRNHFKDIYIGNVFIQCTSPAIWLYLGIFLWNGYISSLPLLLMKEYALFGFSLARNLLIMAVFFYTIPLVLIAFLFVMKRLKGVIGEHEYSFGGDGFIERTSFNQHTLSYGSVVRFFETRRHYLLVMPNMNGYIIPRRDLSAEVQGALKEKLKGTKPVKKLFAPYAVFGLVAAAIISLVIALPMAKYTMITTAMPFRAVWDSNVLYISGGKSIMGQKIKYSDMLGFGPGFAGFAEPPSVMEQYLWVVRDGKTEPYILETTLKPITICLDEGRLYALHLDVKARKKVLSFLTPGAFVEDQSRQIEDILKACGSASERNKDQALKAISVYEWDDAVGRGKNLQLPIGSATFELGMKAEEPAGNAEINPLGDSESGKLVLSGRWVLDRVNAPEILYSVTSGIKVVNKETYERYFGK